ncbi:phage head closure protein [Clostridium sp. Marseille-QA1073]
MKDKRQVMWDLEKPLHDHIIIKTRKKVDGPVQPLEPEYDVFMELWSKKEHLRGREFWAAKAVNAENSVKFYIRYRTDINTEMKLLNEEVLYDINAVYPLDNSKMWTIILANEVKNVGI